MDRYNIIQKISPTSDVYIVSDGEGKYVMKKVKIKREIDIYQYLSQTAPHIVPKLVNIETNCIVCELCDQTLAIELQKRSITDKKAVIREIAKLVADLHNQGVAHGDIKPENIVVCNGKYKLIDFGLSKFHTTSTTSRSGTTNYMAPEVVKGERYNPFAADVWSLGLIFYEIICGSSIWSKFITLQQHDDIKEYIELHPSNSPTDTGKMIARIATTRSMSVPKYVEEKAADLLLRMLKVEPDKRLTMNDVLCHVYFF